MGDLFDIANLITAVGVDAVKIKPEPGLPQKSSNEILTELFSTFDVPDDDEDEDEDGEDGSESSKADGESKSPEAAETETPAPAVSVKQEKDVDGEEKKEEDVAGSKKKKSKKKHKHKSEGKDKEKKHKHKKKSKHSGQDSPSDPEQEGSKKKKKKKKSKRKHDSDAGKELDNDEPKSKTRKLDKTSTDKSKRDKSREKSNDVENIKIKKEKDVTEEKEKDTEKKIEELSELPSISKKLDDDPDGLEVPKLLEKTKNPINCKIQIKDLKNSEVYNNVVKEIENKKKEKAEKLEDGEITDSDEEDENRTPTLSPTPPPEHVGLRSDRKKYSSPSSKYTKKNDLRNVLKDKERKKNSDNRSRSRNNRKGSNRSKDRDYSRSRSCHSRERRSRSRSGNRDRRGRGRSRERRNSRRGGRNRDRPFRDDERYNSRSEDRNRNKWRGRSRSKERKEHIEIDKKKLLEIARKNAISMIMKGKLPLAQQDKAIAAIQAGGKSIEELTDFCKNLSKSEAMGELSSISSGDESGSERGFHHPFLLKERPNSIIMNIRDAKQLPTKTLLEKTTEATSQLRLQFPVSSGQHHRKNESEWIPVTTPKPSKNPKPEPKKLFVPAKELLHTTPQPLVVPPLQSMTNAAMPIQPMHPTMPAVDPATIPIPQIPVPDQIPMPGQMPLPEQVPVPMAQPMQDQSIYQPPEEPVDISTIVSQRLAAMRKLSENPHDMQALNEMYKAQSGMKTWVESKQMPTGQFTGSTGANVLTPAELNSGPQAWVRKDQLLTAQPVSGGMGMALLQKMGWKPGEGLGKNKEGALEPLQLEIKLDKKGLVSDQDIGAAKLGKVPKVAVANTVKSLEGKHPVSLLGEYCSKRKYGAPVYELCYECGPDHKKNFIFKVKVNGVEYKPAVASPNKKLAKAEAAQVCLQSIGLLQ